MNTKETVMNIAGFDIIKVTKDDIFVRYFAQKNGKAVTEELGSPTVVATRETGIENGTPWHMRTRMPVRDVVVLQSRAPFCQRG